MECDKCNGHGSIPNQKYYNHSSVVSYERGITVSVKCKKCNGTGYIIGNMKEALHDLNVLLNSESNLEKRRILKQIIQLIQN